MTPLWLIGGLVLLNAAITLQFGLSTSLPAIGEETDKKYYTSSTLTGVQAVTVTVQG